MAGGWRYFHGQPGQRPGCHSKTRWKVQMKKFLLKTCLYALLILGVFEGLYRAGFLPVVTDSSYFDHKMAWLQAHPLKKAELVVVGSSVPLYGVDSRQMVELPLSYFNFCSWNVKITECWIIVRSLVADYR